MMVTIMFAIAATLLVLCLVLLALLLSYKETADYASAYATELQSELSSRTKHLHERLEAKATAESILLVELDESREEAKRLTGELEVANLSLKNAQEQVAEHVIMTGISNADREEYRDMLKNIAHILANERDLLHEVLKEWQDFESQGG